ncbi:hypothetical protein O3G_MSEX009344 [Manduca sexta]|uniref:Uncharacterized protein n=1 Tax=Manduca sexta TaxID=7130 RepID=A0A921ZF39_MANSE|nr:hypothetical protein O3G_MSEX009344 [Manduca sexta]
MFIYFLILCIVLSNSKVYEASINILEKGVIPLDKDSVGIQFYVDIVNEDQFSTCGMRYWTNRCCFIDPENSVNNICGGLNVYGAARHTIKPRDRDTLFFVYPTLIPYDQIGTCSFVLDYNCANRRLFKREEIEMKFDTRLKVNKELLKDERKVKSCDALDLDSLNECKPIDCEMKYIGMKPYFDGGRGKCIDAAICEADPTKDLPDLVYNPKSNTCKDLENPLTIADIYAISSGLGVVTEPLNASSAQVEVKSNCSTISQHLQMLRDMMYGKLYPISSDVILDDTTYSSTCKSAFLGIISCILGLCGVLLAIVFCVNSAVWFHRKWTNGDFKKCFGKMKKKYKKCNMPDCESKKSRVNKEVKNDLLKDVIVTDLPIELRDSVLDLCERVNREVKWKRRYRIADLGSQVNLMEQAAYASSRTSSTTTLQDNDQ